jgi:class 3 adenylate cyclase/tetratricopeptide (TPR) repeat protein
MSHKRTLQTVLFTDITGSTARAAELGDQAWRELLDEHHARVRTEIKRFSGRESNTAGDGFLATFDRPARAICCAWAIREVLKDLGLEIRSGIHAGEVEGRGREISGIAVHTGARVAAAARSGEVLVSSTVRDLVAGTGFRFSDRGTQELKGVPGEWRLFALESLPAGTTAIRTNRWIPELPTRVLQIAAGVGVAAIIGLAVVLLGGRDRTPSRLSPGVALAENAAPGIAVLPFQVSGSELDEWREGMVTLLSTNLDGAGDLRAIDSRTVLAQWDARAAEPGGSLGLDVARATGARYAILGSAVAIGPDIRLVADVYDVESEEVLGQGRVEGAPDSVLALVDQLAVATLGVIQAGGEGELPQIDLASLTTSSIPGLKSFLEGEVLFRASEFEPAIEAYERAVAADSTFALAWYRIGQAHGWLEGATPRTIAAIEQAAKYSERLPERKRLLVQTDLPRHRGLVDGIDAVRDATRRYPDDAEAWYLLAETYFHLPDALASVDDAQQAFERAVALDPAFLPYRIHLHALAFSNPPDSARAANLIAEFREISPSSEHGQAGELALAIAFGDSTTRTQTIAALDTLGTETLRPIISNLFHPLFWEYEETLLLELVERDIAFPEVLFRNNLFKRGKLQRALTFIDDPDGPFWFPTCSLFNAWTMGIPIPDEILEERLSITPADTISSSLTVCGGAYAVDKKRWGAHEQGISAHRKRFEQALAAGDSIWYREERGNVNALEGYARWKRGDVEGALRLFQSATLDGPWDQIHFWIGQILLDQGRPADAIPHFRTFRNNPLADLYIARAYEMMEEYDQARDAYGSIVEHWKDADPELEPLVEQGRQGLIRTGGVRRE